MKFQWIVMFVFVSLFTFDATAKVVHASKPTKATKTSKASKKVSSAPKKKLSTEVDFDGSTLHGRYQKSAETLATVEGEKAMMDLLGNRKNFKDRLAKTGSEK